MKRLDQIDPSVCIESLPFTISSPGRYTLCGDLVGVAAQSGITILSSDVTLDGGGFVLEGVPGSLDGIFVDADLQNVRISNLTIRSWDQNGLHAPAASVACRNVHSSSNWGNGFKLNFAVLEDCTGNENGEDGCNINAFKEFKGHVTLLKRSSFSGNNGAGLRCVAGSALDCDDVRCDSNGAEGFSITGADGHVTVLKACASSGNAGTGLFVVGTERLVCEDSSFRDNDSDDDGLGDGLDIVGKTGHVTILKRCDSSGNGGSGLRVSSADLVVCEDSSFQSNGQDGMRGNGTHFPSAVIVIRCDSSSNVGSGLRLSDTSGDCDDSRFVGNGENGITTTVSVADVSAFGFNPREISVSRCDVSSNVGHGLHASTLADDTSLRVALSLSSLSGNGLDGCRVDCPNSSVSSSIQLTDCVMNRNFGSGLHVTPGPDEDCDGLLDRCVANNNGVHGFHIDASSSSRTAGWNLKENKGSFNEEDGFRYGGGGGAGKVSMQDFHFAHNGGHGLHVITGGSEGGDGLPPSSLDLFTHNGRLLDNEGDGLHVARGSGGGAGKVNVQDLSFVRNGGNGATVACPATFEDCDFSSNAQKGLEYRPRKSGHVTLIKRVAATNNGQTGIEVSNDDDDPTVMDLHISEAVSSHNGGHGLDVDGGTTASSLSLNFAKMEVKYNGQSGARVSGGASGASCDVTLASCDFSGNSSNGLHIIGSTGGGGLPGGTVIATALGGRCDGNGANGIVVQSSSSSGGGAGKATFKEFTITRNTASGFRSNCPTTLEDCDSSNNGVHGVAIEGRKEFKGHVTLLKRVACTGNAGNGIDFDSDAVDAVIDLHLDSTVCSSNGQNGLHASLREPTLVVALACTGGSFNNNDLHGMLIVPVAMDKGLRFNARSSSFSSNGASGVTAGLPGPNSGISSLTVVGSEVCDNNSGGIDVDCDTVHLESNTISSNTGNGISLSSSRGGVVRDNTCSSNTERGITINTTHVEYATNRCVSNGISGIEVAGGFGNVVRDNFLSGNTNFGIVLSSSENRLYENQTGVQVNPLFESAPGLFNDTSPGQPAAIGGSPNIGF